MYKEPKLKLKINGRVDKISILPSNGLAQGCPLSPVLYLLCLQSFLSLIDQNNKLPEGIKGITLPDNHNNTTPGITSLVSGFADDLGITLKNTDQLTLFKPLLTIYENGSGAKNSWDKSLGIRLGSIQNETSLPPGWEEGIDIVTKSNVMRYLGTYLGEKNSVKTSYDDKTIKKVIKKTNIWKERGIPRSREGKFIAMRNSILAQMWYLIENQFLENTPNTLECARIETWNFYNAREQQNNKNSSCNNAPTDIKKLTLIQDYPEGGMRAPDVELFTEAIYINKIARLLEPRPEPHTNLILFWINQTYGHLRQGLRILTSSCDFLQI